MAITGAGFLDVSRAQTFSVSRHALDRIWQYTDLNPTRALATVLFNHSRQVRVHQMLLMGYRPGYIRRLREGTKSWYFRFLLFGEELIAVVTEGAPGEYAWVTTLHPTRQTECLQVATYEMLAA